MKADIFYSVDEGEKILLEKLETDKARGNGEMPLVLLRACDDGNMPSPAWWERACD